jgi:hypothetical protein
MKLPIKQRQAQTAGRDTPNALLLLTGRLSGSRDSSGFIGQAGLWLVQNIEMPAAYTRFNGASHNYDGSGRDEVA